MPILNPHVQHRKHGLELPSDRNDGIPTQPCKLITVPKTSHAIASLTLSDGIMTQLDPNHRHCRKCLKSFGDESSFWEHNNTCCTMCRLTRTGIIVRTGLAKKISKPTVDQG